MSKKDSMDGENLKLLNWYDTTVIEDIEDCLTIGAISREEIKRKWNVAFGGDEGDEDGEKAVLGFYSCVFEAILEELQKKRTEKPEFAINFANIVEIGYDNSEDDGEQEKVGNFCPYMIDLKGTLDLAEGYETKPSIERFTEWMSGNIKDTKAGTINSIAMEALKKCKDKISLHLAEATAVIPMFCTIQTEIVKYMQLKRMNEKATEVMINFAGNFNCYCRLTGDGDQVAVEYAMNPSDKLSIKSDAIGTAPSEG